MLFYLPEIKYLHVATAFGIMEKSYLPIYDYRDISSIIYELGTQLTTQPFTQHICILKGINFENKLDP